ncbi:MAG: antibiotic biosynthesis monooxygenase [Saccharospirillaceae bacterium]|nr:antibiotic biosynthesis monooxygenase [Saccharospirillaceae bacterium]MCD8531088.1 antibiotic biosynthesis monooxygenase [Saccharospirillaceae bacterium]
MLDIIAFIEPKTHTFDKCRELISDIITVTRAEEGCLRFELYHDPKSNQLILVERWINQQALDLHYQQPYVRNIFDYYQDALLTEPKIIKLLPPALSSAALNPEHNASS